MWGAQPFMIISAVSTTCSPEQSGPVLAPLADGCFEVSVPELAVRATEHLWENRRIARAMLSGDAYAVVLRSFAELFSSALAKQLNAGRTQLEPELIGLQLAAGQLAVLSAWLSGRSSRSCRQIADALHGSGRALVTAMLEVPATSNR